MNEADPHFRIGALTETLEWTERALAALLGRDSVTPEAIDNILFTVRGSLRRDRARAVPSTIVSGAGART